MKKILIVLSLLVFLIAGLLFYIKVFSRPEFKIFFFNVGQGDSALIKFENGQKMLVDCGADKTVLYKLGKYLPFWDRQIDYLLISHFDLDHYGGCIDVVKRYEISTIITNGLPGSDDYYGYFDNLIDLRFKIKDLRLKVIDEYSKFEIGSSTLEFLWPLKDVLVEGDNNNSVVFKLSHNSSSILFMGDLEIKGEQVLMKEYCFFNNNQYSISNIQTNPNNQNSNDDTKECAVLDSDILKVAHHGSAGSSGEEFLQAVSPKQAIISVGENKFGHPSRRVIKKLERLGVKILRTDILDDIIF